MDAQTYLGLEATIDEDLKVVEGALTQAEANTALARETESRIRAQAEILLNAKSLLKQLKATLNVSQKES